MHDLVDGVHAIDDVPSHSHLLIWHQVDELAKEDTHTVRFFAHDCLAAVEFLHVLVIKRDGVRARELLRHVVRALAQHRHNFVLKLVPRVAISR